MIRLFPLLLVALTVVSAESLRQGERDRALSDLHATQAMYLHTVDKLTEAQWNYKPSADRWSIAEVAEHIAISEVQIFKYLTDTVMKTPEQPPLDEKLMREGDANVLFKETDRSKPGRAPKVLQPTGAFASKEEATAAFKQSRARAIEFLRDTQENLRGHRVPNTNFGEVDGYQWLLLISAHSERHTKQIREVMEADGFPD
jgi:DinB family protein